MEVDKTSFYPLLLDVLTDISTAHFVAIDLELSGVPTKQQRNESGRQTLQQRYLETKEAAERYQILQIGITCVQQDIENNKYILQPYNFDLSPLIEERGLDIERIFSFQSGAAEFLLKTGFDIGKPFKSGVPYLSRAECREARDKHAKRQDKSAVADIQIKPTEVESLAFLERVRTDLNALLTHKSDHDYVNIGGPVDSDNAYDVVPPELSRFEKRLVHQLVRAEFPDLVTISKRGFVQVVRFNKEREDRIRAERMRELDERINKQKGFRWIIEAMIGRELANLDLREVAKDPVTGEHIFCDMGAYRAQFHEAQGLMRGNPRILMGHNCFLDLVYIYRTFIGTLPDTVTEFQAKLHELWPVIVDTKYMSTHNCGDINPVSSLEQIAHQLSEQQTPKVETDEQHVKYNDVTAFHEAGYDSFLTAQIAVRLSASLENQGAYVDVESASATAPTNAKLAEDTKKIKNDVDSKSATSASETKDITNGNEAVNLSGSAFNSKPKDNGTTSLETNVRQAAHGTDGPQESDNVGFTPSVIGHRWKYRGDPTLPSNSPGDPFVYNPKDRKHRYVPLEPVETKTFEGGMPCFASDFWRVYGNKLRVFGTEEAVCVLDGSTEERGSEEEDGGVGIAAV